ncbi:MAG TPA: sigma-70 family RNA polymerase sigma factor [Gemmataceae bacterium]|nr:sigma-70 family RNA polymerase sigma factor [Gemmataceae bacterium]
MPAIQQNRILQHLRRQTLSEDSARLGDGQLLHCFIAHRDDAAFEALVRRHGPMVLGVCRRILCDPHDADDAFQATFLVLVRKAASVSPPERVGNWLYGVACQTARKARVLADRRRVRERQVSEMPEPAAVTPDPWDELRPLLDQEVSRLPEKYRLPIVLCDLEGRSGREAARQLGWPEGTVSGRLCRARALLAKRLTRRGVGLSGGALGVLLSGNAARARVPTPLIEATVKAARLFVTGTAEAMSVLPAKVITLTEGVLRAMQLSRLKLTAVLLLLGTLVGLGGGAFAQRTPAPRPGGDAPAARVAQRERERGPAKPEVRGIVKSVDSAAGTITVTGAAGREEPTEKTYPLAKNVEVGVGSGDRRGVLKEIKLADLAPGAFVSLALSADGKTVESILASGPQVRGVLKSVDAGKNMITIALSPTRREETGEEKTYSVDAAAEIGLDDGRGRRFSVKEAKLADLPTDSVVTVWLSVDQKHAQGIIAEGPNLYGVVKAVDAAKNTLTLTTRSRGGDAEEKTLDVAKNAITLLDDGRGRRFSLKEGKLADVPAGAQVFLKLTPDQKFITMLRAEGPSVGGRIKALDPKAGTITVDVQVARGENPEEKTFTLAKNVRVQIEGNEGKLADIKVGDDAPFAMLRLSLDQKTVQSITVSRPRGRE